MRQTRGAVGSHDMAGEGGAMNKTLPKLVRDLIRIGTGELAHLYAGVCPDAVAGRDSRDEHCPACRVLMEAEATLTGGKNRQKETHE